MNLLKETYKKTGAIHHAYAFEGEKVDIVPSLFKFLEKDFGVEIKNNPDFSYQEFETFTIDDGRALQELHGRRAISAKKIFIISTRFVTTEAQNALLKIFEEPTENSHFFLIMPNTQVLIPTLRSRLVVVERSTLSDEVKEGDLQFLVKKFLSASVAERLALIKNIIEEKDKGKAIDFVTALEQAVAPQLKNAREKNGGKERLTKNAEVLSEILMVKKYLHDRSPSVKLLLEHLCLFVTMTKS
jgi:DNA polymerase III delta prime subunit